VWLLNNGDDEVRDGGKLSRAAVPFEETHVLLLVILFLGLKIPKLRLGLLQQTLVVLCQQLYRLELVTITRCFHPIFIL